MRDSYFIKFFKYVISIRLTRSDDREKEENDNLRFREQTGENIKIQVDDETPDFLKNSEQDVSSLKVESKTENQRQTSEENTSVKLTQEVTELIDNEVSPSEEEKGNQVKRIRESLLDNKPLVKMFEECAGMIKNLERISPAFESEDSKDLINTIREQLVQAMILSGGKTIDNEKEFNTLRHKCLRGISANDGDKIINTLEPGVTLEERVFVKALVEIAN
ncbi:MAG: hypothetical protein SPF85_06950 [Alloprevotella sp.]|nr:hypothetical protein [Alloprevotella sp.]